MADIQRQADISRGQAQSRAIGAGAFGGSRSALLEGESQRPFIEQMARTSAGLRESGFQQAQQAAQSDIARQQQLGMFGAEQQQQRALQQAQFGQQAGLTGFEAQQQRALEQARLGQQAGLAGQDIQSRMAMFAPEFELRARQQQAGLLGGISAEQQAKTCCSWSDWRTTTGSWTSRATISLRRVPKSFGLWASTVWFIGCGSRSYQLQQLLHHKKQGWVIS
jgi:hypothetical protein